jgi:hypothetical protein
VDFDEIVYLCDKANEYDLGLSVRYFTDNLEQTILLDSRKEDLDASYLRDEEGMIISCSSIRSIELVELPNSIAEEINALYVAEMEDLYRQQLDLAFSAMVQTEMKTDKEIWTVCFNHE